jgi:hypothetical protein
VSLGGGRRGRVETLTRSRSRARSLGALLALAMLCGASGLGTRTASAVMVGGGGSARMDCLAVFDAPANTPAKRPKNIRCTDGDASCDADGAVNGVCEFPIAVCANSAFNPACSLSSVQAITVDHAIDDGDPKFDPALQALQARIHNEIDPPTTASDQCTAPSAFRVAIRGPFAAGVCKPSKRVVKMTTLSGLIQGKLYRDVDRMKLRCDPAPEGCSAQALFTGTFDRIQRQIFNQSCAVSGCHDSQSRTGELLLESGAAYTNLVDVAPENAAAAAAGWKRVRVLDATSGDPATSLLVQKLIGPPPGFGARMPFNAPRLDQTLIDVVQLWVAAGAPETGWVPGTD